LSFSTPTKEHVAPTDEVVSHTLSLSLSNDALHNFLQERFRAMSVSWRGTIPANVHTHQSPDQDVGSIFSDLPVLVDICEY
jgi:hypothetical protein